ncbi:hypothetical protein SPHV1_170023 [Novosphingobium sp. KN65.2]|nr:hypothetical protein SPHV1_170023 [Novosphingobium sp. KN65.2]
MMESVGPVDIGDGRPLPDLSRIEQGEVADATLARFRVNESFCPLSPACGMTLQTVHKYPLWNLEDGDGIGLASCHRNAPVVYAATYPQAATRTSRDRIHGAISPTSAFGLHRRDAGNDCQGGAGPVR